MSEYSKLSFQLSIVFILIFNPILRVKSQTKQSIKEFQTYVITESKVNGVDNTAFDLDRKGNLTITEFGESGRIFLLNDSKVYEEYSFGPITNIVFTNSEETTTNYKGDTLKFNWHFHNSNDENTGNAEVIMFREFKPEATTFRIEMKLAKEGILEYSGYLKSK